MYWNGLKSVRTDKVPEELAGGLEKTIMYGLIWIVRNRIGWYDVV